MRRHAMFLRTILAMLLGAAVLAGPAARSAPAASLDRLGTVHFPVSCAPAAQQSFDRAVALLHSFFYSAAAKAFAGVAEADPGCAMAHWGVAMSQWYPLWFPPGDAAFARGQQAVAKAKAVGPKTDRERDYIAAIEKFYTGSSPKVDHQARAVAYEKAMEQLVQRNPEDREAKAFHALALLATANPKDKTYAQQLKSAGILEKISADQPDHPGLAHYLIHAYDVPALAQRGLPAARQYGQIAPSVPHALHMPSHIYTQLGMWQESIRSNRASEEAARELGDPAPQFHAIDYQVYADLQGAQDAEARRAMERMAQIPNSEPTRNQGYYGLAASSARYALERGRWAEAAALQPQPSPFPYTEALTHFARALGAARNGDPAAARKDVERLEALRETLVKAKMDYWATQVEVQRRAAAAWLARAEGRAEEAVTLMRSAADLEGTTDKSPVMPAQLVPARELLGDLLLEVSQPAAALREYEASLANEPNRFRGFAGAAKAAAQSGDREKARAYAAKLVALCAQADAPRPELTEAKALLAGR